MDFGPVGLTVQRGRLSRADSSMLSQLSFESGLTERVTDFTDGWSENSASRLPSPSPLVDRRLCQAAMEAFEGGAAPAGHAQQDNHSSSTSSEFLQPATITAALQICTGKRKAVACNNSTMPSSTTSSGKVLEANNSSHTKCSNSGDEGKSTSAEELTTSELVHSSPKSLKASSKLQAEAAAHPHAKQDFIHVRARRGQATDSHSLAERVRREKISERMKFLQDLVPGCSKVTGKAVMLDEIINYVQSLQRQIEFLSMKLAAVDPQLDVNLETLLNKETRELHAGQARSPETTLLGPDPAIGYREFQAQLQLLQQINSCNMDLRSSVNNYSPVQLLPPLPYSSEGFVDPSSQMLNGVGCDGDLQTIVHMANSQAGRSEFLCQDQFHGPGYFSPGFLKVEY